MHPHPAPRRASRALIAAALLAVAPLAVALLVTSCGPAPSRGAPTATPTPTATALYASDEEALAAAEEVYREYLEITAAILRGEVSVDRLDEVLKDQWLEDEKQSLVEFLNSGRRVVGDSHLRYIDLEDVQAASEGTTVIVLVCEDISDVDVLDSTGTSVIPEDRYDMTLMKVILESDRSGMFITPRELEDTAC